MKWYQTENGTKKTVKEFLFIPVTIDHETHWLETATIVYEYICWVSGCAWKPIQFVD